MKCRIAIFFVFVLFVFTSYGEDDQGEQIVCQNKAIYICKGVSHYGQDVYDKCYKNLVKGCEDAK